MADDIRSASRAVAPSPSPSRARGSRRVLAVAIFLLGLLLAGAQIVASGWLIQRTWLDVSVWPAEQGWTGQTLWGGQSEAARLPPRIGLDNDPYYWIEYARFAVATGAWRVRHTDLDNTPFGREVHWSSGLVWWLALTGRIQHLVTGQPLHEAIAGAAMWANPALFAIVLVATGLAVWRRMGVVAGAATMVVLAALPAVQWDFGYARADHHSLHLTAALGLTLCLVLGGAGWVRGAGPGGEDGGGWAGLPTATQARRWFVAAGIFAGLGLWVGATQQVFVIAGVGAGALAASLLLPLAACGPGSYEPRLWRTWGLAAGLTGLALYALEYLPAHAGMRLEVNHPLYALAAWGGGELLCQVGLWRQGGRRPVGRAALLGALAVVAVALAPLALLAGPSHWHAWRDPYMRRLHDAISEFQPLASMIGEHGWPVMLVNMVGLPVVVPVALALALWPRTAPPARARLLVSLAPVLVTAAMMVQQVRWQGFVAIGLVCVALACAWTLWGEWLRSRPAPWAAVGGGLLVGVLVIPGLVRSAWNLVDSLPLATRPRVSFQLAQVIASRDVALTLQRYARGRPFRAMCGPSETPALFFFGGGRGCGALYWENIAGIRDTVDFFSDPGDADARRIALTRGIDFVIVQENDALARDMFWCRHGRKPDDDPAALERTLAYRLASPTGDVPEWLEPLPFYGSPTASSFRVRIYRVRPTLRAAPATSVAR